MIAPDTNVLIRLLINDDRRQVEASLRILQNADQVLLLSTVLLETVWVLQAVYDASREEILAALEKLFSLAIPESPMASKVLDWFREGMDFADALHLAGATSAHCDTLYSFDRHFVKTVLGKSACAVARPG